MRKPVIAGNWKMNMNYDDAVKYGVAIRKLCSGVTNVEIIVCPPSLYIESFVLIANKTNISVGAQNIYWEDKGAYTGEISAPMLADLGCFYVIIGHSERRQFFNETDETVNKKVKSALKAGIVPIMCVGESLEQREANETNTVVREQLTKGLADLTGDQAAKVIIAYEPIWAIGTGKTATSAQAEEVCAYIRQELAQQFSDAVAEEVIIQYGGSVKPDNIKELMEQPNIDGALVGGASLDAESFAAIVKYEEA